MIWAIKNNERIKAIPKEKAICPLCNKEVISKCGDIKIWHWSHKADFECDTFGEPESEWHLSWKNYFPKEFQEFKVDNHRADIKTKEGLIIEVQNSPISIKEVKERENFYGNMIWILNGNNFQDKIDINKRIGTTITFKWNYFPKSFNESKKQIYVDNVCGNFILINTIHFGKKGCRGSAILRDRTAFIINQGGKVNG